MQGVAHIGVEVGRGGVTKRRGTKGAGHRVESTFSTHMRRMGAGVRRKSGGVESHHRGRGGHRNIAKGDRRGILRGGVRATRGGKAGRLVHIRRRVGVSIDALSATPSGVVAPLDRSNGLGGVTILVHDVLCRAGMGASCFANGARYLETSGMGNVPHCL